MSATPLPSPEQAYNHLFTNVHARAFFGKLASLGFQPRSEKEAADMLELAGKLRMVEQQTKQASATANPYAQASNGLDQVLAQAGLDGGIKQASSQERDVAINQVAAQVMEDPDIYNSVLSLKAAEAEQVATQLGLRAPAGA